MSLRDRLVAQIRATGPLTVAEYMSRCLHDPVEGYYATRPALGAAGDFITAPLVSQMFGELIGLWMVETWRLMGRPTKFRLVEMGPGDGTLMEDLLRATKVDKAFLAAAEVWLVEVSEPLKKLQRDRLGTGPRWVSVLADIPGDLPILLIANELLDCLPVRQFSLQGAQWAEHRIGVDANGELLVGLSPVAALGLPTDAPQSAIYEVSTEQERLGHEIGERIALDGGAALLIDYGRASPGFGDTLQALSHHRKVDPLESPGGADLTVHADFPSVRAAAERAGAKTGPILTQAEFLARLGIVSRAETLAAARPEAAELMARQFKRLTDADQMGELFKVLCIHAPGLVPPAFEAGR